jgi:hypothetical protein
MPPADSDCREGLSVDAVRAALRARGCQYAMLLASLCASAARVRRAAGSEVLPALAAAAQCAFAHRHHVDRCPSSFRADIERASTALFAEALSAVSSATPATAVGGLMALACSVIVPMPPPNADILDWLRHLDALTRSPHGTLRVAAWAVFQRVLSSLAPAEGEAPSLWPDALDFVENAARSASTDWMGNAHQGDATVPHVDDCVRGAADSAAARLLRWLACLWRCATAAPLSVTGPRLSGWIGLATSVLRHGAHALDGFRTRAFAARLLAELLPRTATHEQTVALLLGVVGDERWPSAARSRGDMARCCLLRHELADGVRAVLRRLLAEKGWADTVEDSLVRGVEAGLGPSAEGVAHARCVLDVLDARDGCLAEGGRASIDGSTAGTVTRIVSCADALGHRCVPACACRRLTPLVVVLLPQIWNRPRRRVARG